MAMIIPQNEMELVLQISLLPTDVEATPHSKDSK